MWLNNGEKCTLKSTRFVTACFIMSFIAYHEHSKLSTPTIARWVNTNASRVRQIVASLVKAGLLQSTLGGKGGVKVARDPKTIRLIEIFDAVAEQEAMLFSIENPFSDWKDRCRVHEVLTDIRSELGDEFRQKLSVTMLSALYYEPPAKEANASAKGARRRNSPKSSSLKGAA